MKTQLYFKQVHLLDPSQDLDQVQDLYIDAQGHIATPPAKLPSACTVIDRPGLYIAPGLCDVHVHFRDPGSTDAEDLESGMAAAANGGFTRVATMPNTSPATDSPELLRRALTAQGPCSIYPTACATQGRLGHAPADIETLAEAGASAFTDDGAMISKPQVMAEVMRRVKALDRVVMDHAVRPDIALTGIVRECPAAAAYDLPIFPPEAEVEAVRDDIARCRETGCPVHIQHLSCAGSVELIAAAQAEGLPVTGEVTPHHMALAAEDIPGDDGNWRMNPPLGNRQDVQALRQGLLDGTLTLFATDHAPHKPSTKCRGFRNAPFGIIGLETALGISWDTMVRTCGMTPLQWARCWITEPNRLLRLRPPTLALGQEAELVIFDPELSWQATNFASKSTNTPWLGKTIRGRALATYRKAALRAPFLPEANI